MRIGRLSIATVAVALMVVSSAGGASGSATERLIDQEQASVNSPGAVTGTAPDLTAKQASDSLREHWPAVASHLPQSTAATPPIERYLGDSIARVPTLTGKGRLIVSSRPLRARGPNGTAQPVDLNLRDLGPHREPTAAPFELRLPDAPGAPFVVGPDTQRAVTVTPLNVADDAATAQVIAGKTFLANTQTDTDTLMVPVIDGLETFEQIRSPEAPEQFRYRLGLTANHHARLDASGSVIVSYADDAVLRVLPPIALDAEGDNLPASLSLDGDILTVTAQHRQAGVAYPVMLDPNWVSSYDYLGGPRTGLEGWGLEQTGGGPGYDLFGIEIGDIPGTDLAGLFARPRGGGVYPEGASGRIIYVAPGTTRIARADWQHVSHFNDSHRQALRLALYGSAQPQLFDRGSTAPGFAAQNVTLTDPTAQSTTAQIWLFTPPCTLGESNCPRFVPADSNTFANVGAVDFELTDNDYPTLQATGPLRDLADQWTTGDEPLDVSIVAADAGSGIAEWQLTGTNTAGEQVISESVVACDEEHTTPEQGGNICPFEDRRSLTIAPLPEGKTSLTLRGTDFAGNASDDGNTTLRWDAYVDRTAPTIDATGPLRDAADTWTNPTDGRVRLAGRDTGSGISTIEFAAYDASGNELLRDTTPTCTPPGALDAPCPADGVANLDIESGELPDGEIRFVATATDHAGNRSSPLEWKFRVDRRAPVARATGDLTRLAGDWTNATAAIPVDVRARDIGSGVQAVRIDAVTANGRQTIAEQEICAPDITATSPCAREVDTTLQVDPANLPDGRASFQAVAVDLAQNESADGTDWDTYFDRQAPDAPRRVTVKPKSTSSVEVTWERPPDDGSGVAGYEFQVLVEGQPVTTWQSTPFPLVKLGGLPSGLKIEVLVRAVDAANNVSKPGIGVGRPYAAGALKAVACAAATGAAYTADLLLPGEFVSEIVNAICDTIRKGVRAVEGKVKPIVERMCKSSGDVCEKVISKGCGIINRVWSKGCEYVKKIACFASDLDTFCTTTQKKQKRTRERRDARLQELRRQDKIDIPFGSARLFGRDRLNRATGARADVSPQTVRQRRERRREGEASTEEVTGIKSACNLDRGHLIGRILGGPGDDPRNFVPLPASFNRGLMAGVEKQIAKAISDGRVLKVDVRPVYSGTDPVPTRVIIRARTLRTAEGVKSFSLDRVLAVPRPDRSCARTRTSSRVLLVQVPRHLVR